MQASNAPVKFLIPFANAAGGGYIATIPKDSQIGIANGRASLTDGFVPLNFTPIAGGGTPYFGQDLNGILNQVSAGVRWLQAGGLPTYDATFAVAIGGYPNGAMILNAAKLQFNISTADNNLTNPDAAAGVFTGVISGTNLTITGVTSGVVTVGQILSGAGITANTQITAMVTGTGGNGTYTVSASQTVSSTTITASGAANWVGFNADMVDGFHASQSVVANAIAVRNSSGIIPGDITGNANYANTAGFAQNLPAGNVGSVILTYGTNINSSYDTPAKCGFGGSWSVHGINNDYALLWRRYA